MILATSPVYFRGHGMALRRAVLKREGDKYVVHDQYIHSNGSNTFGNGNYFPAFNYKTKESDGLREAFQKAHAAFLMRCEAYAEHCIGEDATDRLASPSELESMASFVALANAD